jgi:hypothetical protein
MNYFSPKFYSKAINEGYSDKEIVSHMAKTANIPVEKYLEEGYSHGEIARFLSGIDETQYQNYQNPVVERSLGGDILHRLSAGAADVLGMTGDIFNTIGMDKAGEIAKSLKNYAYENLDIIKPDESEAYGEEGYVKGAIMEGIQSLIPSAMSMVPAVLASVAGAPAAIATGMTVVRGLPNFPEGSDAPRGFWKNPVIDNNFTQ